jgi:hypothetical protein
VFVEPKLAGIFSNRRIKNSLKGFLWTTAFLAIANCFGLEADGGYSKMTF